MLLSRDYVGYMAGEIVKRLVASNMIETSSASEKTMRLSHIVTDVLVASEEVEFVEDRDTIRQKTVQILQDLLKEEEAVDAEIRKKISSQKKEVLEGSEEWDVLYRKYYAEEMRRMGIVHQPNS